MADRGRSGCRAHDHHQRFAHRFRVAVGAVLGARCADRCRWAGPAVAQIRTALEQRMPGGFDIAEVADTASAEQLIRDRRVYGAIDLSSGAPQVIVASAAGTAVAQTLQTMAAGLGQDGNTATPRRSATSLPCPPTTRAAPACPPVPCRWSWVACSPRCC